MTTIIARINDLLGQADAALNAADDCLVRKLLDQVCDIAQEIDESQYNDPRLTALYTRFDALEQAVDDGPQWASPQPWGLDDFPF